MKILHTLATLDPASGGPARSVPQLALALAEQGHEVGVWSAEQEEGIVDGGWRMADLDEDGAGKIRVLGGGFEEALVAFGRPDLVHDHGIWLPCHREVAQACARRGLPRVVSPRGMLEPWALNHKKWKKRVAWWLYQRRVLQSAAALHATAESEAAQLRKLGLRPPVVVAANGVRLPEDGGQEAGDRGQGSGGEDRPSPIHDPPSTIRHPRSPRTALFLSRIHPKKGLPLLLEAWAKVKPEGWRLRVVGPDEGGHLGELKALADRLGLDWEESSSSVVRGPSSEVAEVEGMGQAAGGRGQGAGGEMDLGKRTPSLTPEGPCIRFCPALEGEAKWRALRVADLFILPSHSENFGIVVAEALAAGTPVITTTGTPWELLETERCGWWVEVRVEGLADALAEATRVSPDELAAMGRRGRAVVADRFSWDRVAGEMTAAYEGILGEKGGA